MSAKPKTYRATLPFITTSKIEIVGIIEANKYIEVIKIIAST